MTKADWVQLFAPAIAALVLALAGLLTAVLSGLSAKLSAYFAHQGNTAAALELQNVNALVDKELEISASVLAGKIDTGALDYTNRAAWQKEAVGEVALIKARLPDVAKAVIEQGTPLLVQLMSKVDSKVVASPTINVPGIPLSAAPALSPVILQAPANSLGEKS